MLKYFGTDGVRGVANKNLTATMAYRIGRCLGQYPNGKKNRILVCRDTRVSGDMLRMSVTSGILASGGDVYDEGISTTPSISYLVKKEGFDFGVMISASHNPYGDNGIKIFNSIGEKLDDQIEEVIEEYMDRPEDDLPLPDDGLIGRYHEGDSLKREYIDWLAKKSRGLNLENVKVLVDCANGSASYVAPSLYSKIGLDATFINASPNGVNINKDCGSTHLESLKDEFAKGGYDLAFAFDGDSDRFMALSPDGRLIDGDALIFLSALSMRKSKTLKDEKVVITVMSNFGLRKVLDSNNIGYNIVGVGDKYVQAELKEHSLSLGGEQSGHVIFLDELNTGDGLLSSLKLLGIYCEEKDVFAKLKEFVVYPQVLKNVHFSSSEKLEKAASSPEVKKIIDSEDGRLGKNGRILVRKSGTEPLLRIMVEAPSDQLCESVASSIESYVLKEAH
ncbi:MAG: phosphoglucosamine mutase [Bacilli bacterium]|jgi:phosphoglucosamine mutase|nr:phosphoglucosamine mutase [Bacilli bacterium]MCH4228767.1 phosphoglucosamine mutase [Bacilli bacterium]MCH4278361.1 phosphoglucosamine mutase [Bacilli bacterium]MCI2055064.1 phosphoglucosamine mutase [Bacilli bacterium]